MKKINIVDTSTSSTTTTTVRPPTTSTTTITVRPPTTSTTTSTARPSTSVTTTVAQTSSSTTVEAGSTKNTALSLRSSARKWLLTDSFKLLLFDKCNEMCTRNLFVQSQSLWASCWQWLGLHCVEALRRFATHTLQ